MSDEGFFWVIMSVLLLGTIVVLANVAFNITAEYESPLSLEFSGR